MRRLPFLLALHLFHSIFAGKILIYSPSYSASHIISNGRIADTLVDAGHEVVMLIPELLKPLANFNGTKKAKIIRIEGIGEPYETMEFEQGLMESKFLSLKGRLLWEDVAVQCCRNILLHKEELERLRKFNFDAAFTEQIEFCGIGLIEYLGIKNLLWISTTPLMDANSYNLGIPQPTSYVPVIEENDHGDRMGFWERLDNQIAYFKAIGVHHYGTDGMTEIFRSAVSPSFPSVRSLSSKASVVFVNTDPMFDLPRPLSAKVHFIGGLGLAQPKPLDQRFSSLMAKGRLGVVVMSLGSVAVFDSIPLHHQIAIVDFFRSMPDYHFAIKISSTDNTTEQRIEGISNIETVSWIPQSDLLGHPRLKLFITHGGINGMIEAIHRAVPMVVVPVFADQFRNGRNAEKAGIGKVLCKLELEKFSEVVTAVLRDENYKKNAIRLAKLVKEKPYSPEEVLTRWTKFVIDNGPLDHLHLEGADMNPVVYFNLDVLAVIVLVPVVLLYILLRVLKRVMYTFTEPRHKVKTH